MLLDIGNPIWYRERRAQVGRSKRLAWWKRVAWGGVLALWVVPLSFLAWMALKYPTSTTLERDIIGPLVFSIFVQLIYVSVRSIIVGSAAIARERDLQTWETLLSTPMGLARLVTGKYLAVVIPLFVEVAVAAPFLLLFLLADTGGMRFNPAPLLIANFLALNLACILFFGALGLFISACAPSTTKAATRAVVVAAGLFGGTWLLDFVAANSSSNYGPHFFQPCASLLNPIVAECSFLFAPPSFPQHGVFDPLVGYGTLICYGVATLVCICWTKIRLSMESGR